MPEFAGWCTPAAASVELRMHVHLWHNTAQQVSATKCCSHRKPWASLLLSSFMYKREGEYQKRLPSGINAPGLNEAAPLSRLVSNSIGNSAHQLDKADHEPIATCRNTQSSLTPHIAPARTAQCAGPDQSILGNKRMHGTQVVEATSNSYQCRTGCQLQGLVPQEPSLLLPGGVNAVPATANTQP